MSWNARLNLESLDGRWLPDATPPGTPPTPPPEVVVTPGLTIPAYNGGVEINLNGVPGAIKSDSEFRTELAALYSSLVVFDAIYAGYANAHDNAAASDRRVEQIEGEIAYANATGMPVAALIARLGAELAIGNGHRDTMNDLRAEYGRAVGVFNDVVASINDRYSQRPGGAGGVLMLIYYPPVDYLVLRQDQGDFPPPPPGVHYT